MSADGNKLVAIGNDGIYVSNDGAATWSLRPSVGNDSWQSVAISADGSTLVAANYGGYIYTSTDDGNVWTEHTATDVHQWQWVAVSANGQTILGVPYDGSVYRSVDGGDNWTTLTIPGSQSWDQVAMSSDGMTIALSDWDYRLYTSTDKGDSWNERTIPDASRMETLAMSANGQTILATSSGYDPWVSINGGASWAQVEAAGGSKSWHRAVVAAGGSKLFAVEGLGYLFTGSVTGGNEETPPEETPPTEPTPTPTSPAAPAPVLSPNSNQPSTSTTKISTMAQGPVVTIDESPAEQPAQPPIDLMKTTAFMTGSDYKLDVTPGQVMKFNVLQDAHTMTIDAVDGENVTFTLRSTPQKHTLRVGETGNYDVNSDNVNDLSVTVNRILGGVAELSITKLAAVDTTAETKTVQTEDTKAKPVINYSLIAWIAGGVVALLIVILIIRKAKRA
jgi:hypothetical protein